MPRHVPALVAALCALVLAAAPVTAAPFPARIALPDGWAPEGITAGRGLTAYVGSLANGAVAEVDLRTGEVDVLVPGAMGRIAVGLDYDARADRLWVAGGPTGEVRVYDASSGALLATYSFAAGFLNDVVVTRDAVYVTDSAIQQLIVIPLGPGGALTATGDAYALPLTGDLQYEAGFNANGIVAFAGQPIVVQSNTGQLFRVDPETGTTYEIDLGGASVSAGDGLELRGATLYVVRNQLNQVAVLQLRGDLTSARLVDTLTSTDLQVPTTAAFAAGRLWLVNARFGVPVTPDTEYWLTQLRS